MESKFKEFLKMCIARANKFSDEYSKANPGAPKSFSETHKDALIFFSENQDLYKSILKQALIELDLSQDKTSTCGICACVSTIIHDKYLSIKEHLDTTGEYITPYGLNTYVTMVTVDQIIEMAEKWPAFSGNRIYPVPLYLQTPEMAYSNAKGTMWVGEYGDNRKALLKFLIAQLN